MGLFKSSPKKLRLGSGELRQVLDRVKGLDNEEEKQVLALLQKYAGGGISKREVKEIARKIKRDAGDKVGRKEAGRIEEALLALLDEAGEDDE